MYTCKQMIVMRRDLKMRKGKIAAQAGHACVEAILRTLIRDHLMDRLHWSDSRIQLMESSDNLPIAQWFRDGEAKVCVYVDSENELLEVERRCREKNLISALICDAGLTEFHGEPTITCLAIEPLPVDIADSITGDLPLY